MPRWKMPEKEMLPQTAYQIVRDEMMLDGNARQNLATFVGTWMDPVCGEVVCRGRRQEHD